MLNMKLKKQLTEGNYTATIISFEEQVYMNQQNNNYWKLTANVTDVGEASTILNLTEQRSIDMFIEPLQAQIPPERQQQIDTLEDLLDYFKHLAFKFNVKASESPDGRVYYNWRFYESRDFQPPEEASEETLTLLEDAFK